MLATDATKGIKPFVALPAGMQASFALRATALSTSSLTFCRSGEKEKILFLFTHSLGNKKTTLNAFSYGILDSGRFELSHEHYQGGNRDLPQFVADALFLQELEG